MKKVLLFFSLVFITGTSFSQSVPRFTKYAIGSSGCSVYLPDDPGEFDLVFSEDSSEVYSIEIAKDEFTFGMICVKFRDPLLGLNEEDQVEMLIGYMNFIKGQFNVSQAAGFGKGHTLESNPLANGVIDFWEDIEGKQYAVKGWIDNYYLGLMFLYGDKEYPYLNAQEMFLNGFRFPDK